MIHRSQQAGRSQSPNSKCIMAHDNMWIQLLLPSAAKLKSLLFYLYASLYPATRGSLLMVNNRKREQNKDSRDNKQSSNSFQHNFLTFCLNSSLMHPSAISASRSKIEALRKSYWRSHKGETNPSFHRLTILDFIMMYFAIHANHVFAQGTRQA